MNFKSKENIFVIILAAGKGTRINAADKPKAMYPVSGKPMVGYFVDLLKKINPQKSIIVVGFYGQQVIDYMEKFNGYQFVWQKEQLGTGHAVAQAGGILHSKIGITFVVNVDNPFFRPETFQNLAKQLSKQNAVMVVSMVELSSEFGFGRLVIDKTGHIEKIVEVKNASSKQLQIKQMNSGLYAFRNSWLWQNIDKVKKDKISGEYYLTDLVAIADSQKDRVIGVPVAHPNEAIGINTLENIKVAEEALKKE